MAIEIRENSNSPSKGLKDSEIINYSPGKAMKNHFKASIVKGSMVSQDSNGDSRFF